MKLHLPLGLLFALVISLNSPQTKAADIRWAVDTGNWSDTSSWNGGILPGPDDVAQLHSQLTAIVDNSFTVHNLHFNGDSVVKNVIGAANGNGQIIFNNVIYLRQGNIVFGDGINDLYIKSSDPTNKDKYIYGEISNTVINEKVTFELNRIAMGNYSGSYSQITLNGGTILIRGNSTEVTNNNTAPLLIGHYDATTNFNIFTVESGLLDVSEGVAVIGYAAQARLIINGGVSNFKRLAINQAGGSDIERSITVNGGRMNIGSGGITWTHTDKQFFNRFGGGTIGAFDDWTSSTPITLTGTNGDTTFDTLDSKDNSTARTITLSGILSGTGGVIKEGEGTLILSAANDYTGGSTVKGGIFNVTGTIAATSSITVHNGATVQGGGISSYNGAVNIVGNSSATPAKWDTGMNAASLSLSSSSSKLEVIGSINLSGDLNITLDTAANNMGPMISVAGGNSLTLAGSSKIVLYAYNDALDQSPTGVVNLTIITPHALSSMGSMPNIVWERTDEKYIFDSSNFLTTGQVSWTSSGSTYYLLTAAEAASTPFTAPDATAYVGAREAYVVFQDTNTYTPYDGNTRLTDGNGTFVFQPQVASTGALFVSGMRGGNSVILTNNSNAQSRTEVTDTTLVVDSSQGSSLLATGTTVGILGKGAVNIYGTSSDPGAVELRTGGDTAGTGVYTVNNTFRLDGNAHIIQSGANTHQLTGTITINPGSNASIENKSAQDLIISSAVQVDSSSTLGFKADSGRIVLSGKNAFNGSVMNISGSSGLAVTDGYTVNASTINLNGSSLLTVENNSVINLGSGGITEGDSISISNSTINFQDNSSVKTAVTTAGTVTLTTKSGKKNILEKGLSGSADIIKTGEGKLVISSATDPSTTGTITLKQGALQLGQDTSQFLEDGKTSIPTLYSLKGDLNVESGTLSGIIDAGNNNIHFGSSSVFALGMDSENLSSQLTNAKTVSVDKGATILVDVLGQGWTVDTDYYIISANDAITGEPFALKASGNFAFVEANLRQTDKNVILTLSPKIPDIDLDTRNKAAIFPTISTLVTDALEGRYGSLNKELLKEMQYVSKMTVEQLDNYVSTTALSAASLYSAISGQVANTTRHVQGLRNHVNRLDPVIFDKYQLTGNRYIWAEGFINYSDVDSTNYAPGYQLDAWGAHTGIAFSLSEKAFFGTGFGYISGETKLKDGFGETESDTFNIDLFGRYKEGNFSLLAVVSGGFSSVDYTRSASLYGDPLNATASADGSQVLGMIEAAYDFQLNESGSSILQPLVNVTAGYVKYDAFDEKGLGNAGYHVDSQQVTMSTLGAGVRYIFTYDTPDAYTPYYLEARAMVTQDVGDTSYDIKANYIGSRANVMHLQGVPLERTAFIIGASASIPISRSANLFGDVTSEFRSGQNSISANVGLSFMF